MNSSNVPRMLALTMLTLAATFSLPALATPQPAAQVTTAATVRYRTISIDGVKVFYREAGAADAPAIVLLHGFPTSSNMFRNLIPALADRYHVIAPDYPGFGHSDMPDRA